MNGYWWKLKADSGVILDCGIVGAGFAAWMDTPPNAPTRTSDSTTFEWGEEDDECEHEAAQEIWLGIDGGPGTRGTVECSCGSIISCYRAG
jgi:hypothetical protein